MLFKFEFLSALVDSEDELKELVGSMTDVIDASIDAVEMHLAENDAAQVKFQIHKMKSPLNNMEIKDLSAKISDIEQELSKGTPLDSLKIQIQTTLEEARVLVKMLKQSFS